MLLILFIASACNDSFSPHGDFHKSLVVFSLLDTRYHNQIIKLQSSFELKDSSPDDKRLSNLNVTLSDGFNVYQFHDTTIASDNYTYLVSDDFSLRRGIQYSLSVKTDAVPEVISKVIVPESQYIYISYKDDKLQISHSKGSMVKGFLLRYYINFVIVEGNQILSEQSVEMPVNIITEENGTRVFLYPSFNKSSSHEYSLGFFSTELSRYAPSNPAQKLLVKNGTVVLFSIEESLYNYLSTINGFNDPISVRLDIPNYSNIANGHGIFSAIAKDSLTQNIPDYIVRALGFESFNNSN